MDSESGPRWTYFFVAESFAHRHGFSGSGPRPRRPRRSRRPGARRARFGRVRRSSEPLKGRPSTILRQIFGQIKNRSLSKGRPPPLGTRKLFVRCGAGGVRPPGEHRVSTMAWPEKAGCQTWHGLRRRGVTGCQARHGLRRRGVKHGIACQTDEAGVPGRPAAGANVRAARLQGGVIKAASSQAVPWLAPRGAAARRRDSVGAEPV